MHADTNPMLILDSVDSTNNYAMGIVHEGSASHGNAFFALEQTSGKGRRGKVWKTDKGKNITLSIIAAPHFLAVNQQFQLSIAASLSCLDLFKKYAGDDVKIKWPNDLFWNDRKAGGILIENVIQGNVWQWAVIGIGININQTDFDVSNNFLPVSLKQITGKDFNVVELGHELHAAVLNRIEELKNDGFEKMLTEYNKNLFKLNEKVKLKKDNIVFETTIKGVSSQGNLLTVDILERQFTFDEVEWIRK